MAPTGKVVRILDGDTLEVAFKIRLAGVRAPESKDPGGPEATARLAQLLPAGTQVSVFHVLGETTHGRMVAVVQDKKGVDVGQVLIDEGLAEKIWPRPMTLHEAD